MAGDCMVGMFLPVHQVAFFVSIVQNFDLFIYVAGMLFGGVSATETALYVAQVARTLTAVTDDRVFHHGRDGGNEWKWGWEG
jgi:hypothetical protein